IIHESYSDLVKGSRRIFHHQAISKIAKETPWRHHCFLGALGGLAVQEKLKINREFTLSKPNLNISSLQC
ncbi:MAG: hypothetical protein AB8I58_19160, partial [Anaerolineales bacterium]